MIIIGEKLNSSIPRVLNAFSAKDSGYIIGLIKAQEAAGADFLDVNTAICGKDEQVVMEWVIGLVLDNSKCGIMIDSPSAEIILKMIPLIKDRKFIINSISLVDRIEELLKTLVLADCGIVCLPIGEKGMPKSLNEKLKNTERLIERLTENGVRNENIYIDILLEALATEIESGKNAISTIKELKLKYPEVHAICGLSNISFGLPDRVNINSAFLAAAIIAGLDSVIMDITNSESRKILYASRALAGKDDFCVDYIKTSRRRGE